MTGDTRKSAARALKAKLADWSLLHQSPSALKQLVERALQSRSQAIADRFHREIAGVLKAPRAIMESYLAPYFELECLLLMETAGLDLEEPHDVLVEFYRSRDYPAQAWCFRKVLVLSDRLQAAAA